MLLGGKMQRQEEEEDERKEGLKRREALFGFALGRR